MVFLGITKQQSNNSKSMLSKANVQDFDSWSYPYPDKGSSWLKYLTDIEQIKFLINKYNNINTVILYNYPAFAMLRVMKLCNDKNIKVISDCTEWYGAQGEGLIKKSIKGIDSYVRMRILNKKIDGVIAISSYLTSYYKRHVLTVTLPPLVDKNEEKWVQKIEENSNVLNLVFSGTIGRNKEKMDLILNSLSELQTPEDYRLNILGLNKNEYIEVFPSHKLVLQKLNKNIHFLGRVSHRESLEIIQKSDFSIFLREDNLITKAGFPTKLVESLSSGIPVITNDTSDVKTYIINEVNGFVLDNENIEEGINNIFNLPLEQLKKMKDNVNDNEFHYKNWLDIFSDFFNKIR